MTLSAKNVHLVAHCEDCGAVAGEYCSPICQQDAKNPTDMDWRTTGLKPQDMTVQVLVAIRSSNKWITITKECPTFKKATDMIARYKKDHGYIKARVVQTSKQIWNTP